MLKRKVKFQWQGHKNIWKSIVDFRLKLACVGLSCTVWLGFNIISLNTHCPPFEATELKKITNDIPYGEIRLRKWHNNKISIVFHCMCVHAEKNCLKSKDLSLHMTACVVHILGKNVPAPAASANWCIFLAVYGRLCTLWTFEPIKTIWHAIRFDSHSPPRV